MNYVTFRLIFTSTLFTLLNTQSLRSYVCIQLIHFAVTTLWYTPLCFQPQLLISAFRWLRCKKRVRKGVQSIAFPSMLCGVPFHIENWTFAQCSFWLEYASKTPLGVAATSHMLNAAFLTLGHKMWLWTFTSNHIILKTTLTLHFFLDMKGGIRPRLGCLWQVLCAFSYQLIVSDKFPIKWRRKKFTNSKWKIHPMVPLFEQVYLNVAIYLVIFWFIIIPTFSVYQPHPFRMGNLLKKEGLVNSR